MLQGKARAVHRAVAEGKGQGRHLSVTQNKEKSACAPPYIPGNHKATSLQNLSLMFPNKLWDTFAPLGFNLAHVSAAILQGLRNSAYLQVSLQRSSSARISHFCERGACQGLWAGAEGDTLLGMAVPWTWQFPSGKQSKAVLHTGLILASAKRLIWAGNNGREINPTSTKRSGGAGREPCGSLPCPARV